MPARTRPSRGWGSVTTWARESRVGGRSGPRRSTVPRSAQTRRERAVSSSRGDKGAVGFGSGAAATAAAGPGPTRSKSRATHRLSAGQRLEAPHELPFSGLSGRVQPPQGLGLREFEQSALLRLREGAPAAEPGGRHQPIRVPSHSEHGRGARDTGERHELRIGLGLPGRSRCGGAVRRSGQSAVEEDAIVDGFRQFQQGPGQCGFRVGRRGPSDGAGQPGICCAQHACAQFLAGHPGR